MVGEFAVQLMRDYVKNDQMIILNGVLYTSFLGGQTASAVADSIWRSPMHSERYVILGVLRNMRQHILTSSPPPPGGEPQ
jgi:hypothetical protein